MPKLVTRVLGLALLLRAAGAGAIQLDPTFGHGGIVTDYTYLVEVTATVVQPDGKTLAAGSESGVVRLVRYTQGGVLDDTFGSGGTVTGLPLPYPTYAEAMVLQGDGRILIAGSAQVGGADEFLVARFLTNGALDPSFGSAGYVTTDFPGGSAWVFAIAIQSDGRIVVAGGAGPFGPPAAFDYAAARYDADGSLDASFGTGGRVVVDMGGGLPETARGLVIRTDGRILLGGLTNSACGMAGLLPDGTLDPSFGASGKLYLSMAAATDCTALALQPDGKVIAAGGAYRPTGTLVVRLHPDGSLDPTFGTGGVVTIPDLGEAAAVALDAAGRIALAVNDSDFVLARLLPDGRPDPSVGPYGWTSPRLGGNPPHNTAHVAAIAIAPNGAIVLGGSQTVFAGGYLALVRYVGGGTAAIPTLSEVGEFLLAALLGLAGLLAIRRSA